MRRRLRSSIWLRRWLRGQWGECVLCFVFVEMHSCASLQTSFKIFILPPISRIVFDIIGNSVVFVIVSNDMIVKPGLPSKTGIDFAGFKSIIACA